MFGVRRGEDGYEEGLTGSSNGVAFCDNARLPRSIQLLHRQIDVLVLNPNRFRIDRNSASDRTAIEGRDMSPEVTEAHAKLLVVPG